MTAEKIYDELMKMSKETISSMSKSQFGDVKDLKGTDVTIYEQERYWKMSAAMASISAEAIGKMPQSLKRIIEIFLILSYHGKRFLIALLSRKLKMILAGVSQTKDIYGQEHTCQVLNH